MIGMLRFLAILVACSVVVFGVLMDRWWRWTDQPWWWATVLCTFAVGVGRFLAQGDLWIAAWLALLCCAAGFNLRATILARQRSAARHRRTPDAWERL